MCGISTIICSTTVGCGSLYLYNGKVTYEKITDLFTITNLCLETTEFCGARPGQEGYLVCCDERSFCNNNFISDPEPEVRTPAVTAILQQFSESTTDGK